MRYAKGVAALAMAVALTVAGCGGGSEEPSELDLESDKKQSESASPSPTPTEEKREQAAIEAIKTWIDTSNKMTRTLDPSVVKKLESLSLEKCKTCQARVEEARELAKVGGGYQGDFKEKVSNFEVTGDSDRQDELQILADVRTGDWKAVGKGGTVRYTASASEQRTRFVLQWEDDQWSVREVVRKQQG